MPRSSKIILLPDDGLHWFFFSPGLALSRLPQLDLVPAGFPQVSPRFSSVWGLALARDCSAYVDTASSPEPHSDRSPVFSHS